MKNKNKKNQKESENNIKNTENEEQHKVDNKENDIADELIKLSQDLQNAEERISELEKENNELKDQNLRRAAEFDNYKRRTEVEQANILKYAGEKVITAMLPVYDDLFRSLSHLKEDELDGPLAKGLRMVYDKFTRILEEQGVKKIEAKGEPFNVEFHEALMQREAEDVPPHTVLDEVEPGYMYKDKVIRHAKVIVSQES